MSCFSRRLLSFSRRSASRLKASTLARGSAVLPASPLRPASTAACQICLNALRASRIAVRFGCFRFEDLVAQPQQCSERASADLLAPALAAISDFFPAGLRPKCNSALSSLAASCKGAREPVRKKLTFSFPRWIREECSSLGRSLRRKRQRAGGLARKVEPEGRRHRTAPRSPALSPPRLSRFGPREGLLKKLQK